MHPTLQSHCTGLEGRDDDRMTAEFSRFFREDPRGMTRPRRRAYHPLVASKKIQQTELLSAVPQTGPGDSAVSSSPATQKAAEATGPRGTQPLPVQPDPTVGGLADISTAATLSSNQGIPGLPPQVTQQPAPELAPPPGGAPAQQGTSSNSAPPAAAMAPYGPSAMAGHAAAPLRTTTQKSSTGKWLLIGGLLVLVLIVLTTILVVIAAAVGVFALR